METIAKHIIFKGRVQGVGFRFTAFNAAKILPLTGFVRNLRDGSVEMLLQGSETNIQSCIDDIIGRFDYQIEAEVENTPYNPQYQDFKITF